MTNGATAVDTHLAGLDDLPRETLEHLRATLRKVLPHADEGIKYGMPTFLLHGKNVAHYDAFKDHCSYFPASGQVLAEVAEIGRYATSKGGLRFGLGEKLPVTLVRKLVKARLAEIAQVTDGLRREYHPDGSVKAEGRMKGGLLHGDWRWYRADGSLLRTGSFVRGEKSGEWATHTRPD